MSEKKFYKNGLGYHAQGNVALVPIVELVRIGNSFKTKYHCVQKRADDLVKFRSTGDIDKKDAYGIKLIFEEKGEACSKIEVSESLRGHFPAIIKKLENIIQSHKS
jgi:hypothetical protein